LRLALRDVYHVLRDVLVPLGSENVNGNFKTTGNRNFRTDQVRNVGIFGIRTLI